MNVSHCPRIRLPAAQGRLRGRSEAATSMARSIRIAAVQLRAHDRHDFARSLDSIVAAASHASKRRSGRASRRNVSGYVLGDARIDDAAVDGALGLLRNLARETGTVIVAGAAMRSGHSLRNSAIVIDADGSTAGSADKVFLWHFDRLWFEPGDRIAPIDTAVGRLGVLICADGRIPTIARALVDRGAEMLVMPTAWVTTGRNPLALENVQADLLGRVRARENGVPFVAANKCGAELRYGRLLRQEPSRRCRRRRTRHRRRGPAANAGGYRLGRAGARPHRARRSFRRRRACARTERRCVSQSQPIRCRPTSIDA